MSEFKHSDDIAVELFADKMKEKLKLAREQKGRFGWAHCTPELISKMLHDHVEKGDPIDVANFCMMLSFLNSGASRIIPNSSLTAERERSKGLVEALKYYADTEKMYDMAYDTDTKQLGYVRGLEDDSDMEKIEGTRCLHHGKRARAALAEYEKETK